MLTAHLPAGYILSRAVKRSGGGVTAAILLGSVLPDLDLIWFYLIDDRAIHHHRYWVHAPGFWAIATVPLLAVASRLDLMALALGLLAAIFLHILLDSVAGGVMWHWPISDTLFQMIDVPATRSHFILSFIFHWTFLLELAIWATALILFTASHRRT